MDISKIRKQLSNFASERDWEQFHSPKNLSMALSVEASELVEIFQWLTLEESNFPDQKQLDSIRSEVADIAMYLIRFCDVLKINLEEAIEEKFIENGDKAKITLRFRGREMAHQKIGMQLLKRVESDLESMASVEQFPTLEGRQLVMMMAPTKKN